MSNLAGSLDFSKPWELSDVVLVVEGDKFHVHRCILGMWSEVFSTMFTYGGISMTKFNNLKVKRVKSNLKYTESKLVKKRPH